MEKVGVQDVCYKCILEKRCKKIGIQDVISAKLKKTSENQETPVPA
ncbi:27356_t:CDS:1, partial [Gigaspora margarita]